MRGTHIDDGLAFFQKIYLGIKGQKRIKPLPLPPLIRLIARARMRDRGREPGNWGWGRKKSQQRRKLKEINANGLSSCQVQQSSQLSKGFFWVEWTKNGSSSTDGGGKAREKTKRNRAKICRSFEAAKKTKRGFARKGRLCLTGNKNSNE